MRVRLYNLRQCKFPSKGGIVRLACGGFTLLEVILAVTIAVGILVAMMLFYRQAADLRANLLQETERIATIRLLMDRISADLRTAYSDYESMEGLKGDATSLQVLRTELPPVSGWAKGDGERVVVPLTHLKRVAYRTASAVQGTNLVVTGLIRTEQAALMQRIVEESPTPGVEQAGQRETPVESKVVEPEPLTDAIRFLRFRYWDGAEWVTSWDDVALPKGVEVCLGSDAAPEDFDADIYPFEMFRRVIYIPGHAVASSSYSLDELLDEAFEMEEVAQ